MFNYNHIGKKELEVKNLINNKVYISLLAFKKMTTYIKECSKEIGWLGTVEEVPGGYLIKDTFLFKQQVHSTTCEITPQGLSDFIMVLYDIFLVISWNSCFMIHLSNHLLKSLIIVQNSQVFEQKT